MGADGADDTCLDDATGTALASASDVDTAFVPPPELAWSAAAEIEQDDRQPWRRAWAIAALVLTAAVIVAGSVSFVGRDLGDQQPLQTTVTATTVLSTVVAPSPPPSAPPAFTRTLTPLPPAELPPTTATASTRAGPSPDAKYLAELQQTGLTITDVSTAISSGHLICGFMAAGQSSEGAATHVMTDVPGMGHMYALGMVYAAVDAYCPEYIGR